jgi:hypothetical protein
MMLVAAVVTNAAVRSQAQSAELPQPVEAKLVMRLPDAPTPVPVALNLSKGANDANDAADAAANAAAERRAILLSTSNSKYSTVLKPGQERVPYTVKEKFAFSARESVSPEQFFVVTLGAGYNHLIDGNPRYGTDSQGYGERVGTNALREGSIHFLGDGVFASAFHQDPRYFRKGPGTPFRKRVMHVVRSGVTSHADSDGHIQPDYSGLLARAATAGMTLTYYPQVSANGRVAAETFGYSILGEMGGNLFLEFWPDIIHRHSKPGDE